jgi:F0F1-type ATP synthase membrane subunit b/b'
MVAINTDEIKSLLVGEVSTMQLWEVVKHGEFWLIFVFGMFPLFLTHFLIDNISNAYKNSRREIVDAEKNRKIQILDMEMIELNADKEIITNLLKEKNIEIDNQNQKLLRFETDFNTIQTQIESKYSELQKQIKAIFDDFSARITSGQLFTDVILNSVIAAYKSGFIEFLPEFYAPNEVSYRVKEIDQASNN